jgi:BASS family bile acid:Na+ symporter
MSSTAIVILTLKISIVLFVFSFGMRATLADATFLFRRPDRLLSALVSMYMAMPLFAVVLAQAFDLPPSVKIALVAFSVSPIPPLVPNKALMGGGRQSYAVGLLVAGSVLSIILVPLAMEIFQVVFGMPLQMTSRSVAALVLMSVLGPLAAGIAFRSAAPALADRVAGPLGILSMVLLVLCSVPVLIAEWRQFGLLIGNGTFVAFAAFAVVGLFIGHMLGGPRFEDREVLALYTSARHPAVAIAIAQANFPQVRLALAAILLLLLMSAIVSVPYVLWARRRLSGDHATPGHPASLGR